MMWLRVILIPVALSCLTGCASNLAEVGQAPYMSPIGNGYAGGCARNSDREARLS